MANDYFRFKQFIIHQDNCAMKVTTDACLFGAWAASQIQMENLKIKNVLDIGAGTGLLSLMIAQKVNAVTDAVEIDEQAAKQARENAEASPFRDRITVLNEDIRHKAATKYDIIISNPPFYENELKSVSPQKNTAHHSSHLLLKDVLVIMKESLSEEGRFFLLLPYKRKEDGIQLIQEQQMQLKRIINVRQSLTHGYFRVMIEGTCQAATKEPLKEEEIAICTSGNNYSREFIELLKDYYLYL